jgi:hypothetical protein
MAAFATYVAANADASDDYDACWAADGACTKLNQAIGAGKGLLANPHAGPHTDKSKRAEEYLLHALQDAETGQITKRSPLPIIGRLCWVILAL